MQTYKLRNLTIVLVFLYFFKILFSIPYVAIKSIEYYWALKNGTPPSNKTTPLMFGIYITIVLITIVVFILSIIVVLFCKKYPEFKTQQILLIVGIFVSLLTPVGGIMLIIGCNKKIKEENELYNYQDKE